MTEKIRNSGRKAWLCGAALGSAIFLGAAIPTSCYVVGEHNEEQRLIQRVKDNPLYQASIVVIPAVEQRYIVSDLDGDSEADAVYVTINPEDRWAMHHRIDIYRKGDSDFEKILDDAKSAQDNQRKKE